MLEEATISSYLEYIKSNHFEIDYYDNELNRDLKEIVFKEIASLINNKRAYILQIEKTIVARVISEILN